MTPLTSEPSEIYAGDTISWLISVPGFSPLDGWTLKYNAVSSAGRFAFSSTASGSDYLVSVAKAATEIYQPGTYALIKYVDNGTDQITVERLTLIVKANLAAQTTAIDIRTANEIILDAIDAMLKGTASTDQQRLKLGDKEIFRRSPDELKRMRNDYALAVWQERNPGQLAPAVNLVIRDRYGS